ncbi:hypothetical protein IRY61_02215 [Candidatus Saccharibacteria bacterium]|nr:hypothetical protein [Candidatus Saccharibacteria bacterium]
MHDAIGGEPRHGHVHELAGSRCVWMAADALYESRGALGDFLAGGEPIRRIRYASIYLMPQGEGMPPQVVDMQYSLLFPTM